jgi:hypothetical protein
MRPSSRCFPDVVAFKSLVQGADPSSDTGSRDYSDGTTVRCRVDPSTEARMVVHGQTESVITHRVYFAAVPDDASAGARRDYGDGSGTAHAICRLEDMFVWSPYPQAPAIVRKFVAVGPAEPAARLFSVVAAATGRRLAVEAIVRADDVAGRYTVLLRDGRGRFYLDAPGRIARRGRRRRIRLVPRDGLTAAERSLAEAILARGRATP